MTDPRPTDELAALAGTVAAPHADTFAAPHADTFAAPHAASDERLAPGTRVDRYVLGEVLGLGGMGIVYRAFDPGLGRPVALKLVRPGAFAGLSVGEGQARLLREAQTMAKLSHPNTVAVFDVGAFEDQVFVAMELIDGVDLALWLRAAPRPWRETLAVMLQAGRGLAAAHAAGLVHRDFKPENVLVARDGRVRVVDFGLARAVGVAVDSAAPTSRALADTELAAVSPGPALTQAGAVVGTPLYMAPEQHLGEPVDPRTDQFSFCVTLYRALYGAHPFAGDQRESLLRHMLAGDIREPGRDSEAPRRIFRILRRGLAAHDARYPTMDALLAALERGAQRPVRAWLAGAGAALVVAVAAFALMNKTDERPPTPAPPSTPALPLQSTRRQADLVLLRHSAPGSEPRSEHLTDDKTSKWSLAVSSGGDAIAFVRGESSGLGELFVTSRLGGPPRQLTHEPAAIDSVVWRPDGGSLAYTRRTGEHVELWSIALTRGDERRLAHPGLELRGPLVWASEAALLCRAEPDGSWQILDPTTGAHRPLVADAHGSLEQLRPSPDGASILAASHRERDPRSSNLKLLKVSLVDGVSTELSDRHVWPLGWSRDGANVYATDSQRVVRSIVAIPADGGPARPVLTLPGALTVRADALAPAGQAGSFVALASQE